MPAATLLERLTTTDPEALNRMGFDVDGLRTLQARAQSVEFQLQQMGFDVDRLQFYQWLVENGHSPEFDGLYPSARQVAAAATALRSSYARR